jgi:hypothetical protein
LQFGTYTEIHFIGVVALGELMNVRRGQALFRTSSTWQTQETVHSNWSTSGLDQACRRRPVCSAAPPPVTLYAFGIAVVLLHIFPTPHDLLASLKNFVQILVFTIDSGSIASPLCDSVPKLALGMTGAVLLSLSFYLLGNAVTSTP